LLQNIGSLGQASCNVLERIELSVKELEAKAPNYTMNYFALVQKASTKLMVADLFRNRHLAEETRKYLGHYASDVKEVLVAMKAKE